jgi:hypothetical protein
LYLLRRCRGGPAIRALELSEHVGIERGVDSGECFDQRDFVAGAKPVRAAAANIKAACATSKSTSRSVRSRSSLLASAWAVVVIRMSLMLMCI